MTFRNTKTKKSTTKKYRCVVKAEKQAPVVDEATKISTVKQNTFTEFTVTMSKALEKVAAADFTMVRDNDNQVISIKSATLDDKDKTRVKLVVYTSLTDAKTYTVTYTADDEAKTQSTAQVTVTDGVVADVAITPLEITANKETLIEYQTLDANGVIVSQKPACKTESKVDVSWDSLLGTMDNDSSKYILYNVGDTAKFTVTYHTYKYDTTTGAEIGVITKDFTITAVKDASVVSQYVYTATKDEPFAWSTVTPKQTIALGDEGDEQRTAWFLIKNSKGENVTKSCGYTVESSDNSIVVADGDVENGAKLTPVAKGSAYLMIKDTDGNVVNTMPITVGDKRTISTFKLSTATVNVASSAAIANPETCGFTDITAKDQYGEDIDVTLEKECKSSKALAEIFLPSDANGIAGTIRVIGNGGTDKGSTDYLIKATDSQQKSMTTSLRINAIDVGKSTATYSVVFVRDDGKVVSSVNTTIPENKAGAADQKLTAHVVVKKNSVVVGDLTTGGVQSLKVVGNNGKTVANVVSGSSANPVSSDAINADIVKAVTSASIDADQVVITARSVTNGAVEKYLEPGTYTVVYELFGADGSTQPKVRIDKASASFTVEDKQTPVTAKVLETNCGDGNGGKSLAGILSDKNYVEYYYGDVKIDGITSVDIEGAKAAVSNSKKNVYVTYVIVKVPVANKSVTNIDMFVKVPVNKTFTVSSPEWDLSGITLYK